MKKSIIFLAFAALLCGGVQAQDTLWQKPAPHSNYYYNNWIDTTVAYVAGICGFGYPTHAIASQYVTSDTLRVYGIAAMMVHEFWWIGYSSYFSYDLQTQLNNSYPEHPTLDDRVESLLLYQYHGPDSTAEMLQLGNALPIHIIDTPVTYYVMSNTPVVSFFDTMPKPVYERYFEVPQTVRDTFFVGCTQSEGEWDKVSGMWRHVRPWIGCLCFNDRGGDGGYGDEVQAALVQDQGDMNSPIRWYFEHNLNICRYFIFPILTPKPSGGDSNVAVQGPDMMERYVAVQPNPAHGRATVVSSFGMTAIEVYDTQGRLLQTLPAEGLKADLDVSSWPRATYLLRIRTPMGTVTRKLLVQ